MELQPLLHGVEWLETVFSGDMLLLLLICGGWSAVMVGTACKERGLDREAKVASLGGKFYIFLAVIMFILLKLYSFFF